MSHKASKLTRIKNDWMVYLMIAPGILFFLIFCYVPMFGIVIGFKNYYPFTGIPGVFSSEWVGFQHFIRYFQSYSFWSTLSTTLLMSLYKLLFYFPLPIILAIVINEVRNVRYKKVVQTISYLPYFMSTVIIVGVLNALVSTDGGLINQLIQLFGREPIMFLGETKFYRTILTASYIWQNIGWGSIIYIAAITGIDQQLYEAASLDGAGKLQLIWHITLPGLAPVISIMLVLFMGSVLTSNFEYIVLTYSPGVYSVADTIDTFVYREGLINSNYSFSTAVNLFKSIFSAILLLTTNFISRKMGQSGIW